MLPSISHLIIHGEVSLADEPAQSHSSHKGVRTEGRNPSRPFVSSVPALRAVLFCFTGPKETLLHIFTLVGLWNILLEEPILLG